MAKRNLLSPEARSDRVARALTRISGLARRGYAANANMARLSTLTLQAIKNQASVPGKKPGTFEADPMVRGRASKELLIRSEAMAAGKPGRKWWFK